MMFANTQAKQVRGAIRASLTVAVILWFAVAVGCQPVATAPVSPSPSITHLSTFLPFTATFVPGSPTATQTPPPTFQTATLTPTIVPAFEDVPIVLVGTLIDGTGAEPLEDAVIVIDDGYITAVGPRGEVEIPSDAYIFALDNATILPGFINAHVHSTYDPTLLKRWVQAGITTVRDLGARYPFFLFSARDQYNKDPYLATLISAGPLVTVPGGYPIAGNNFPSLVVTNPDYARREIARLISDGADVIKIVVESGDGFPTLSLETASAIVETAHQWGVPVAAHISSLSDLRLAVDAGIDDFSHIVPEPFPEDLLEQMVANNVYWVPTLEPAGGYGAGNLRLFIDAGGHVALGNDSGLLPGIEIGMPMREIKMMLAAGMTRMEIIVAATQNAAYVCNREDTLGTIEAGKIADILVVSGNPLENLQVLENVLLVIHQGVIVNDSTRK